jgi:hypothetical protein
MQVLSTLAFRASRGIAGSLCLALFLTGDLAATVVRCTMPDGTTEMEGLAAAARCRSEFAAQAAESAAETFSIGATCSDQLLATGDETTAPERVEGRIAAPLVFSASEDFVGYRAALITLAADHRRSRCERAIELLRTVVLQT